MAFFWKARFETYVKSKDIDLWQFIQNGDFYFEVEDEETKLMKETSYELLKDEQKKQIGKNNKAKITLYNALSRKEYERVFMCKIAKEVWHTLIITHQGNSHVKNCKTDLLTQEYEKFLISIKKLSIADSHDSTLLEKTSDDSDSQGGSDEDIDEEEAEAFCDNRGLSRISGVMFLPSVMRCDFAYFVGKILGGDQLLVIL
ncbi:hypothetical protein Tco_0380921 [Tanacetum coccineum]